MLLLRSEEDVTAWCRAAGREPGAVVAVGGLPRLAGRWDGGPPRPGVAAAEPGGLAGDPRRRRSRRAVLAAALSAGGPGRPSARRAPTIPPRSRTPTRCWPYPPPARSSWPPPG